MSETKLKVMKTIFTLSDELEYNIYEAEDIAEYTGLESQKVHTLIRELYDEGCLGECMSIGDDGYETFFLNKKGRTLIGVE